MKAGGVGREEAQESQRKITGIDSEFIAAVTVHYNVVTVWDLPAGAEIKIR